MIPTGLLRSAAVAGLIALGATAGASAQTTESEERRPEASPEAEAQSSSPEGRMREGDQPRERDMMGQDMMGRGMMGRMPMMAMRGHMMKIMFAIADADGDGSLSFDEVTAIHKRIFDNVDTNKDGKVSTEEIQAFMRS
ncbi:EF-hand domain-containing protein [Sinorhizobium garamanticum]|uniref:EF-hand domain-containing protein n=1 Tax=Sinorhizobium garamanticum TaxID=680247 RepID=A0ABY8DH49_9HYPH|nr:EF-hand domain-containing protein [Sinorhizobium garamanticum]WEX90209.1 EF-hand domain-containing protein [Sinorhizobium garamanticum]